MKKLSLISILLILFSATFVTFPAHATACVATYGVYGKVEMVLLPCVTGAVANRPPIHYGFADLL